MISAVLRRSARPLGKFLICPRPYSFEGIVLFIIYFGDNNIRWATTRRSFLSPLCVHKNLWIFAILNAPYVHIMSYHLPPSFMNQPELALKRRPFTNSSINNTNPFSFCHLVTPDPTPLSLSLHPLLCRPVFTVAVPFPPARPLTRAMGGGHHEIEAVGQYVPFNVDGDEKKPAVKVRERESVCQGGGGGRGENTADPIC